MALAHNLLIRYLNSMYLQATGVTRSEDVEAFFFYCRAWCTIIHEHHQGEETSFFPKIAEYTAEKDIMNTSVEQHKAFESGLQTFEKYVTETPLGDYSGSVLRTLLDDFAPALVKHLHAEISTLLAVGEKFGGEKLQNSYDEWEKEIMKKSRTSADPVSLSPPPPTCCLLTDLTVRNATCRFWRSGSRIRGRKAPKLATVPLVRAILKQIHLLPDARKGMAILSLLELSATGAKLCYR